MPPMTAPALAPLIAAGLLQPGDGVLTQTYLGWTYHLDLLPDGSIRVPGEAAPFAAPSAASMAVVNRANPKRRGGTSGWKEIRYRGQCLDDWRKQLSEGSDGRHAIEDPDLAAVAVAGGWPAAVQQLQAQQLLQPEPPCPQLPSLGPPWLPPWLPLGTRTPATPAADHGMGGDLAGPVSLTPVGSQRSASLLPLPAGPADRQQQQGDPLQQQAQPAAASPPAAGLQAAPALQAPQQPGTPPIGDSAVAAAVLAELSAELGQACQQEEAQAAGIWPQLCSGFQAGLAGLRSAAVQRYHAGAVLLMLWRGWHSAAAAHMRAELRIQARRVAAA